MFVGREDELALLNGLYERDSFQMAVVYGRRRVGKTTLLDKLAEGKRTLFFTARVQSSQANLCAFSSEIARCFGLPDSMPPFASWSDALSYVAAQAQESSTPLLFVFDEFPYAAATERSLPSTMQVAIDHEYLQTNVLMVLCGSNEGFMESEVLGHKSPLYGRRTAQIRLQPFDYLDAAKMIPDADPEQLVRYYATFGGTPYYLTQIDAQQSYEQNVESLLFSKFGLLYEEPMMLLRQELREPALYNSVLSAVGSGATKPKVIAEVAGIEQSSVTKYLKTLEDLGLVERIVPFGDNPDRSRKGITRLCDPFFAYWYRFVFPNVGAIESGSGAAAAQIASGAALATYEGTQFETVCQQWLVRQNRAGKLPFLATAFGKWWGTDPVAREEIDIDVIAANKQSKQLIAGECKWRNAFDESKAIETLQQRSSLIKGYGDRSYFLFTKHEPSAGTKRKAAESENVRIVSASELFE